MKLFSGFSAAAPNRVFAAIVAGVLAGISYAMLIPLITSVLAFGKDGAGYEHAEQAPSLVLGIEVAHLKAATSFLIICMAILVLRTLSQLLLLRVSIDATTKLRKEIYHAISRAAIASVESVGSPRLVAMITTDVPRIVMGARVVPDIIISTVTVLGMLGYLLYVNRAVFVVVVGTIAFGALTYQIPMYIGSRYFKKARFHVDRLHEAIKALIHGAKELKLDCSKRDAFHMQVLMHEEGCVVSAEKTASTIVTSAANYGDLISFFVIGLIAFVFVNYYSISSAELVGVIMALLYITGPVGLIINAIPQLVMAKVAARKVEEMVSQLPREEVEDVARNPFSWESIHFHEIAYRYGGENSSVFSVGPLSLSIRRGEVLFIVGGNGSGKSTLGKILTLHYRPSAGEIRFDDVLIDDARLTDARQSISAIYSDYYLFDRLFAGRDESAEIERLLHELDLHHKVTIDAGMFSSLSLSDGQRRRLALLVSFLEKKDLYVFDEWAADQDPQFKHYFYYDILPKLKARGKAVVVISHDDRYFSVADRVVVMENGMIKSDSHAAASSGSPATSTAFVC